MIRVLILGVAVFGTLTIFILISLRGRGPCKVAAENVDTGSEMAKEAPKPEPVCQETAETHSTSSMAGQVSPSQARILKEREGERIRQLDSELAKLDSDAADMRQKIDAWYTDAHARLKRWAEQRQRDLDNAERAAYAWYLQQVQNTRSITRRDFSADGHGASSGYISPYGNLYESGRVTVQGRSSETTNTFVVGNPAGEYQAALIQIKQARHAVEQEFVKLNNQRQRYIDELVNNTYRKGQSIELKKRQTQGEIERKSQGGPQLTVRAIGIASDNRHYAVIDDEFVYEGSIIKGYTVRKIEITSQKIELESNGQVFVLP
jgi:hypothetical protein